MKDEASYPYEDNLESNEKMLWTTESKQIDNIDQKSNFFKHTAFINYSVVYK